MRVLVDGYNVLFTLHLLPRPGGAAALQVARQRLLDLIHAHLGLAARDVLVIFDAREAPKGVPDAYAYHGIKVLFAKERKEADDLIELLIQQESVPRRLTVVSSDQRLRLAATRRGAQAVRAEEFLEWMEKQAAAERLRSTRPATPDDHAAEATPAEPDHWLKEFGHLDDDPALGRPLFRPEDFDLGDDEAGPGPPRRR